MGILGLEMGLRKRRRRPTREQILNKYPSLSGHVCDQIAEWANNGDQIGIVKLIETFPGCDLWDLRGFTKMMMLRNGTFVAVPWVHTHQAMKEELARKKREAALK